MKAFSIAFDFKRDININDRISNLIEDNVSIGFSNKISTPTFAMFEKANEHSIIITSNQYAYKINSEINETDIENLSDEIMLSIKSLYDVMQQSSYHVRLVDIKPCKDVFSKLKDFNNFSKTDNNIIGTGYRYLFYHKDVLSEFKAEPYIQLSDRLFYEFIYNFNGFSSESSLSDEFKKILSDSNKKIMDFEKNI